MKCADCKAANQEVEAFKHPNGTTHLTYGLLKRRARNLRNEKNVNRFCEFHMRGGKAKDSSIAARDFKIDMMKRQAKTMADSGASILEIVTSLTAGGEV